MAMQKKPQKSLAIVSGVVFGIIEVLEANGLVPAGFGAQVLGTVQGVAGIGAIWGLRRAMP